MPPVVVAVGRRPGAGAGAESVSVRYPVLAFWILDPIYGAMGSVLAFFYSVIASYGAVSYTHLTLPTTERV